MPLTSRRTLKRLQSQTSVSQCTPVTPRRALAADVPNNDVAVDRLQPQTSVSQCTPVKPRRALAADVPNNDVAVEDNLGCSPLVPTTPTGRFSITPRINHSSLRSRRRLFPVSLSTPNYDDVIEKQRIIDLHATPETSSDGAIVIGDFSGTHSLQTTPGCHSDVQYITPQTLESLLTATNKQEDKNVLIVDCRYPYEFNGGHIQSAVNIYKQEHIQEELLSSSSRHRNQRTIIVFHCEFSSERAPKMYKFLREQDRAVHADCYPRLHYPEMYVLHGGYKAFYEQCGTEHCQPKSYRPMLHQEYHSNLKKSRDKPNTADKCHPRVRRTRMQARVLSMSHSKLL